MLTTDDRLDSLESGLVQLGNELHEAATPDEIDAALDDIRGRIRELYKRIVAIKNTLQTSREICEHMEELLKRSGRKV